jgi:hypothetical protein
MREDKGGYQSAGSAGTGEEERRSQGEGEESRPGLRCNEFPLFCSFVGERVVVGEASSAGHSQEASIRVCLCHDRKAAVCNMKKSNSIAP